MHHHKEFNRDDVAMFIEIRGIYDGWSIARLKDGSYINRWAPEDRRHEAVERAITYREENPGIV